MAYITIALYLLVISLMLWVVPGRWNIIDSGYAQLDGLFWLSPWLLLLVCPALTMRLFTEERLTGTWDVLRSKSVSLGRIVWGKYLAALTIVVIAQLPCLVHLAAVSRIAEPVRNIDVGATVCAFISLLLAGALLTAVGTWASSLTKSQITAFMIALICGFLLFYGFDLLSMLLPAGNTATLVSTVGINHHLQSMACGVLDLRDIVYFLSLSAVFVVLTIISLSRK